MGGMYSRASEHFVLGADVLDAGKRPSVPASTSLSRENWGTSVRPMGAKGAEGEVRFAQFGFNVKVLTLLFDL